MKKIVLLLFIGCALQTNAQSNFKKFLKLSSPMKKWVILHPFKVKKALKISKEANRVSDSIKKSNLLDGDATGGQVDAFRHAYWMARLRQELGKNTAKYLGEAHEKDNYKTYKKQQLEYGVLPDEISSKMDLFNNNEGIKLTLKHSKTSKLGLIYRIVNAIVAGKMKIIKKDKKGNFLTCEGNSISKEKLKGKWKNKKCLIPSNK
ncbi:MAG: DUF6973 domain-containing protein [Polaribacter sp.]